MTRKKKKTQQTNQPKKEAAVSKSRTSFISKKSAILVSGLIVLIAVISFFAFYRKKNLFFGEYKDYNVLLITIDTLRADHLPFYGYKKVQTPNLDGLARKSFLFEDAVAHIPLTVPSHTSIMTGKLPPAHGVRDNSGFFLNQKEVTLAEILKGGGYTTSAFVSAFVLDSRWQLNQGFDLYFDYFNVVGYRGKNPRDVQRRGDETEIEVEHWLTKNKDKRFFCWTHFYDPHDPYDPPEPYHTEYSDHLYDGEIAFTDAMVGKLLKKVEELGLNERTIVVVTGDHGEGLGQHGEMTHAMFIYNTTLHVPLLIHVPAGKQERIKGTVRHIDLAPTILDLVGIKAPDSMQGTSLIPMINGKDKVKRYTYSESFYSELHYGWSPLQSITTDQYKFIKAPKPELYDRVKDPQETHNLISEKPSIGKVLDSELEDIIGKYSANVVAPQKMDADTEERLRALGYVSGTAVSTPESRKIDPKDKLEITRALHKAGSAAINKDFEVALDELRVVLEEDPNLVDAHFIAGVAYSGLDQYDKAKDEFLKTLQLKPDHTLALYDLGFAYEMLKDLKSAEFWYRKVLQYEQKHLLATVRLAYLYRSINKPEEARSYFRTAIAKYEESLENTTGTEARADLLTTVGEMYFAASENLQAEKCFRDVIALIPDRATFHYNLAQILEAKGDFFGAIDEYKKEIEVDPKSYKAFNNLGILYKQFNRFDEAILCFQKVVELYPDDPRGYLLLASTFKKLGKNQQANEVLRLAQQKQVEINRYK
jgi:arylsulfatase A-like enzyme/tetratricopeptide (TPR) repeat protein